jgi:hypothetical protein
MSFIVSRTGTEMPSQAGPVQMPAEEPEPDEPDGPDGPEDPPAVGAK